VLLVPAQRLAFTERAKRQSSDFTRIWVSSLPGSLLPRLRSLLPSLLVRRTRALKRLQSSHLPLRLADRLSRSSYPPQYHLHPLCLLDQERHRHLLCPVSADLHLHLHPPCPAVVRLHQLPSLPASLAALVGPPPPPPPPGGAGPPPPPMAGVAAPLKVFGPKQKPAMPCKRFAWSKLAARQVYRSSKNKGHHVLAWTACTWVSGASWSVVRAFELYACLS
jgi:hypothetical protein